MTITSEQARGMRDRGAKVRSESGEKIGSVGHVFLDDDTDQPSWVTVKTGLFGTSETFVPLQGGHLEGDDLVVAYEKRKVTGAPRVDPDGDLTEAEEDQLYRHYGLGARDGSRPPDAVAGRGTAQPSTSADYEGTSVGPLGAISGGKEATDAGASGGVDDADPAVRTERDESYRQGREAGMWGNPDQTEGTRPGAAEPAMAGGGTDETAGTARDNNEPGSVGRDYDDSTPAFAGHGGSDDLGSTSRAGQRTERSEGGALEGDEPRPQRPLRLRRL